MSVFSTIFISYITDVVAGLKFGKSFTKTNGSRTIFSAVTVPGLGSHDCAFKCASVPFCDIWEYKDVECTTGFKYGFGDTLLAETAWDRPLDCISEKCVEVDVTYTGETAGIIVDIYNLDECACRCRETPVCVHFELRNDNGMCILKSTIGHSPRTVTDQMIGTPNC
ncbi:uncharacterized protein LOC111708950 [Eurytemora carolleeae]|uniref:uncharacterized protein LOC111708950 n=1 Tax=Eurytemora carolleeae TaxID=1294199 RepID=UPI000C773AFC|nr:uncharacterized protein LOC111708950 [Eurytemora carolleeae]|eukprot:XP_023338240.1 uncharacterized protein LOC111708950 [Eurytemora affinis]